MNKGELTNYVAGKAGLTKAQAAAAIDTVFDGIKAGLVENGKASFIGFGAFEVSRRAARTGKNPKTQETLNIPATNVVKFKPGQALKDSVK